MLDRARDLFGRLDFGALDVHYTQAQSDPGPQVRETAMMPLLVSLNMIPKVALGPLLIVWFSYGMFSNMLIAFSIGEVLDPEKGLGYLMLQVQVTLDTAAMFMAVILITLLGVLLYSLVLVLERLMVVRDARVN